MRDFAVMILLLSLAVCQALAQDTDVVSEESGVEYKTGLKLYNEGSYDQAIEHFQKAFKLDERNVAALFTHGLALYKQGKHGDASKLFDLVLKKKPGHAKALRLFPVALANADEHEKALAAYDMGIDSAPDNYHFYLGKARVLINLKRYKNAVPLLRKARELESDRLEITETLAQTLAELGRMEEANIIAIQILEKNKNHARARVIVADYKRLKGKLNDALEDYRLAARHIETKAYAEHFIEVIKHKLEEIEIEEEYEVRLKAQASSDDTEPAASAESEVEKTPAARSESSLESPEKKSASGFLIFGILAVLMLAVTGLAVFSFKRH